MRFRMGLYGCMSRRADAVFELTDTLLAAGPVYSLPYLSLDGLHRSGHGSTYAALARQDSAPRRPRQPGPRTITPGTLVRLTVDRLPGRSRGPKTGKLSLSTMCAWLDVSAPGFYGWRSLPLSVSGRTSRRVENDNPSRLRGLKGDRRLSPRPRHHDPLALSDRSRAVRPDARVGARSGQPRSWRVTTVADETAPKTRGLMRRNFPAEAQRLKLVGN